MDVLLETIENLKVLKKNHEEDPENYGFDYKEFLDNTVKDREKVYRIKALDNEIEDSEDESNDSN